MSEQFAQDTGKQMTVGEAKNWLKGTDLEQISAQKGNSMNHVINKDDSVARQLWGDAYEKIPKSLFAVVAWYVCDVASNEGAGNGGELRRFLEELDAMEANQIVSAAQIKRARIAIAKEIT